jgi:hypothetical protein
VGCCQWVVAGAGADAGTARSCGGSEEGEGEGGSTVAKTASLRHCPRRCSNCDQRWWYASVPGQVSAAPGVWGCLRTLSAAGDAAAAAWIIQPVCCSGTLTFGPGKPGLSGRSSPRRRPSAPKRLCVLLRHVNDLRASCEWSPSLLCGRQAYPCLGNLWYRLGCGRAASLPLWSCCVVWVASLPLYILGGVLASCVGVGRHAYPSCE